MLGEQHLYVAISINNLALLYRDQEKYDTAELLYLQALEIAEMVLGENHLNTKTFRANLNYLREQQQDS
ncbi:MAG: tetratricopeptide repeat protein [Cyanobacteria bacterium J06607_15]